jgi:hypothetical protein
VLLLSRQGVCASWLERDLLCNVRNGHQLPVRELASACEQKELKKRGLLRPRRLAATALLAALLLAVGLAGLAGGFAYWATAAIILAAVAADLGPKLAILFAIWLLVRRRRCRPTPKVA